ncbi:MAG: SRPBCC domain-containing protein [Actinomycetota bacterium]|nr:SRPBCC domain-containing protein [Actinomycetota bacterium]
MRAHAIELEIALAASVPATWQAIVNDEHRASWWPYLELDSRPGGRLTERWRDADGQEIVTSGEVLEAQAPHRLRCTWRDDAWVAGTEVDFQLRTEGDNATRLRLRHGGWERLGADGRQLRAAHVEGWQRHLGNLKAYVERPRA